MKFVLLLSLLLTFSAQPSHAKRWLAFQTTGNGYTDTKAIQYNASSKLLDCGNHNNFAYNHAFFISAWVKASSLTQSFGAIISKAVPSPYQGWEMMINNQTLDLDLAVDNSHYIERHTDNRITSTSTWYNIQENYTGSGAASGLTVKVNNTAATMTTDLDAIGTGSTTTSVSVDVGRRPADTGRFFQGKIDDIAIWDADESANATTIYNAGHGADLSGVDAAHLKFWIWSGDGGDVTDGTSGGVVDHSGSGFNCTSAGMTGADIVTDAP